MKKDFILKGGNRKKIELGEVQDLQVETQDIPQLEVFIDKVQLLHTSPL